MHARVCFLKKAVFFCVLSALCGALFMERRNMKKTKFVNKHEALVAEILCDEEEWEKKKRFPIGLNILKEGVWL